MTQQSSSGWHLFQEGPPFPPLPPLAPCPSPPVYPESVCSHPISQTRLCHLHFQPLPSSWRRGTRGEDIFVSQCNIVGLGVGHDDSDGGSAFTKSPASENRPTQPTGKLAPSSRWGEWLGEVPGAGPYVVLQAPGL